MERRGKSRRGRWWLAGGLGLLLLVIAAIAAVSWHYSNQVVVPDHSGNPYEIEVVAVGPDTVELERTDVTEKPGIYGIEWEGGSAIVEDIVPGAAAGDGEDRGDETVTRPLRNLAGELQAGEKVRFDTYVFQGDPLTARGLPFTEIEIEGELGPMPAWRIGPPDGRRWAIVVHGINSSRRAAFPIAPTLRAAGLTVLAITYRDDVGAPASPDGHHHMGLTEWRDVEAAIRYALAHGASELILIGHSMGGALVTQFIERSSLADHATAMILDAPALDWPGTIAFGARQLGLPEFAAKPVQWMVGLRIDADWEQLDAVAHADQLRLPTLLFHGTADDVVPIDSSDAFAAVLPDSVTYYRVPEAGHVRSWNVDPGLYEKRVRRFLARVMGDGRPAGNARPGLRPQPTR